MSDFDYWPRASLNALVNALREEGMVPPPVTATEFWDRVLDECKSLDHEGEVEHTAKDLATDVISEFHSANFVYPSPDLEVAIGDLGCAESRLVSNAKGIRGVVYLASHPMEHLWSGDGISYLTVTVSPAIEPSKTLSSQLLGACAFVRAHSPALICSSCATLPALVLAAYTHSEAPERLPITDALKQAETALGISPGEVSAADVVELETFAEILAQSDTPRKQTLGKLFLPPPPPPRVSPGTNNTDEASSEEVEEEESEEIQEIPEQEISTPKFKPKLLSIAHAGLLGSHDSTMTQIDAELLDVETPRKRVGVRLHGLDKETTQTCEGTRRGVVARTDELEEEEEEEEAECEMDTKRGRGKRGRAVTSPPPYKPYKRLTTATATEAFASAVIVSRGVCTTCHQVNVLGWPRAVDGAAEASRFECCGCHDANDDDEYAQPEYAAYRV